MGVRISPAVVGYNITIVITCKMIHVSHYTCYTQKAITTTNIVFDANILKMKSTFE